MTDLQTEQLKCLQWNARSLNKTKLKEFKAMLSSVKPHLVFLSETFWKPHFIFSFPNYIIFRRDRESRSGGVALLVRTNLNPQPLKSKGINKLEWVGAKIKTQQAGDIDVISVYCPKGDATRSDLNELLTTRKELIVAGDLNAHHPSWEITQRSNKCGEALNQIISDNQKLALVTPFDLGTRIHPTTAKTTTIDLLIASPSLAFQAETRLESYCGSDHLPIVTSLNLDIPIQRNALRRWNFKGGSWTEWNEQVASQLEEDFPAT